MSRIVSRTVGFAGGLALVAALAAPALGQDGSSLKTGYLQDAESMGKKLVELSEAMGADTYGWRPMDGVRTVSEVFMLTAAEFYLIPASWGAKGLEGVPSGNGAFAELTKISDKATIVKHLKTSAEYFNKALTELPAERMHEKIQFFGQERTISAAVYLILADMHEHLGQAIAYARSNKVVPPWTARSGS